MTTSFRCHHQLLATVFALATSSPSFATEFVVEPFDGTTGQAINGSGSGTGWAASWTGPDPATFGSGNTFIANGDNAVGTASSSAGSCALSGGADLTRPLEAIYTLGDDALNGDFPEIYFSFIVENPGPIASGHEFRTSLLSGGAELVSFGKRINLPWNLLDSDEEVSFTGNNGSSNVGTWFAVVKLEYNGTDTTATGYLAEAADPDLDLTNLSTYPRTAMVTLTGKASFDAIRINSHNTTTAKIDEIRIGDDLANVTATPDPLLVVDSSLSTDTTNTVTPISLPISNVGSSQDLVITGITTGGPDGALMTIDSALPLTLPAGEAGVLDLTFTPNSPGAYTVNLTVESNDAATPSKMVELIITAQDPLISIEDPALDFGSFSNNPGAQILSVTVNNTGSSEDLIISAIPLTGATQFTAGALPAAIPAGGSADIEITFSPGTADGFFAGSLAIESNDFNLTIPQISLTAFVTPSNTVAANFDFDPNELIDITLDSDGSAMTTWTTSSLIDSATGTGALGAGNQATANRTISSGATGNYLRFSSARESDAQTPILEGGNNESTWSTFSISPTAGSGPLGFNGGEAVIQTYAFNGIGGNNQTNWTLYFSVDGGANWTSLGTFAGAGISTIGQSDPLELRWDLGPIGSQNSSVDFILDPVSAGQTNGTAAQRGTGFDNLYLTLGKASELVITSIETDGDGEVTISWAGSPGLYIIDYSLDLSEGSWRELTDNASIPAGSASGTETVFLPASETNRDRVFYRVRTAL